MSVERKRKRKEEKKIRVKGREMAEREKNGSKR